MLAKREDLITRGLPLPQPTLDNREFYEGTKRGLLLFQRCSACAAWRHYPRPICPACLSREFRWEPVSGRGEVYTWTIVHGPTLPAFEAQLPYNVVDVRLDEGIHFVSNVIDADPSELRAGLKVEAVLVPASDEITLVKFQKAV